MKHRWLNGDARLIIVAGSDTTASTLTYIMYHFARDPTIVTKLRQELKEINYLPGSETEVREIQDAKYLNGIINEALRLHPAVPSGVLRQTPPEGIDIQGNFIPGGVTISSPLYSMGRCKLSLLFAINMY
jgi:cytochrome P450